MFDSNFHDRLVLTTVAPMVVVGGVFLAWVVLRQRIRLMGGRDIHASVASLTAKSIRLSVMVLFTVFPMVSTTIFQTFQYDRRLNDGSAFLKADYSIEQQDANHQGYVAYAIVMCLLYCFGIPVASWAALRMKRTQIQDFMVLCESLATMEQEEMPDWQGAEGNGRDDATDVASPEWKKTLLQQEIVAKAIHQHVGGTVCEEVGLDFATTKQSLLAMKESMQEQDPWLSGLSPLYKDYESEYWWFEVVKFISTLILCGPVTLIPVEGASQVFISMVVSMFMMSLFANCRPYVDVSNDILAQFCQVSLTFAMAVGLLEKASDTSRDVLFGPLLIICTSLNLGLGVVVVAFEFAVTVATEIPTPKRFQSLKSLKPFSMKSLKPFSMKCLRWLKKEAVILPETERETNECDLNCAGNIERRHASTILPSPETTLPMKEGQNNQGNRYSALFFSAPFFLRMRIFIFDVVCE